jgi:hypothetical protein
MWIRDTTVDAREIDVYLKDASNALKKNTIFLDQSYRIPLSFLDKEVRAEKKLRKQEDLKLDSLKTAGDTAAIADFQASIDQRRAKAEDTAADTLKTEITTAFIGHSSEYSVIRKTYTDNISSSDSDGREFYGDRFFLNPTTSHDSLRVMKLLATAVCGLGDQKLVLVHVSYPVVCAAHLRDVAKILSCIPLFDSACGALLPYSCRCEVEFSEKQVRVGCI